MSSSSSSSSSSGVSFCGLLAIVFITLKLIGKIDWSWWWVLMPVWAPVAIVLIFLLCLLDGFIWHAVKVMPPLCSGRVQVWLPEAGDLWPATADDLRKLLNP